MTLGAILPLPADDARGAIPLGYAPNPGLARRFMKQDLVGKIVNAGFRADDLQLPDSVLVRESAVNR